MLFPRIRLRRLRYKESIRKLVRENRLSIADLVYPLFVTFGNNIKKPVPSMPGVYNFSLDLLLEEIGQITELRIPAVLLFGIPEKKDPVGSGAYDEEGIVQQAVRAIKSNYPEIIIITDVCLCEYTDHGHCGIIEENEVLNDPSLQLLAKTALSHARAGADIIAPSDMMDGSVAAIRDKLDRHGYQNIPIMSYSVKYASSYYGPFRDAAGSAPKFGDRRSYQMDSANGLEAIRETALDIEEGADIIMVKPALAYMDIIRTVKDNFNCPLAVYNVSGEYAMVKAASKMGWIDERAVVMETLTGFKRAGADIIITYHAKDVARWIQEDC